MIDVGQKIRDRVLGRVKDRARVRDRVMARVGGRWKQAES